MAFRAQPARGGALLAAACLLALSLFAGRPAVPAHAAGGAWTTFMYDNARDGHSTADPAFGTVGPAWTSPNLGSIFAEPLVYGGLVYVATENDQLYALNESDGSVNWHLNLGSPANFSSCGNINGITGTPVIDSVNRVLYAVGAVTGPAYRLFKVDLVSHTMQSFNAQPGGFAPNIQGQRGALALNNGTVYVPYGGRAGDCGPYHGYVVAFDLNGNQLGTFESTPSSCGGGIWSPGGESVDGTGNIFVGTGNGPWTGHSCNATGSYDLQESVIRLNPTPANPPAANWGAPNWLALDNSDIDIGSTTPTLLTSGLLFEAGKNSRGYVLDSNALGGPGPAATDPSIDMPGAGECMGSSAFDGANIYVGCDGGLFALRLNAATKTFTFLWQRGSDKADSPIIAGGAIWVMDRSHNLTAYNSAGGVIYTTNLGASNSFSTPSAAGGMVFAGAGTVVKAFTMIPTFAGGYNILTSFGGMYSFGNAQYFGNLIDHGYPGPAIGLAETPDGNGYDILTTFGGIYTFGTAGYYGNLIDHGYPGPAVALSVTPTGHGYAILTDFGGFYTFGDAHYFGNLIDHGYPSAAVSVAYTPTGNGYVILTSDGAIYTFGDALYFGNLLDHGYPGPAVGLAYSPSGAGYKILTAAGAIYTFGDAAYQGNLLDHGYPGPAVALSNTP